MEWDFLHQIDQTFNLYRTHNNFIVRERVYKSSKDNPNGLENLHDKLPDLFLKISSNPIPNAYLELNKIKLQKIVKNIIDSLDLFVSIAEAGFNKEEINKFIQVTEMEFNEVVKFIDNAKLFDESQILSDEEKYHQNREELFAKIEDNFSQLTSNYAWKAFEAVHKGSMEGEEKIKQHRNEITKTIALIQHVSSIDYLMLMSITAMKIRSLLASSSDGMLNFLSFYQTLTKIFSNRKDSQQFSYQHKDQILSSNDLKQDVEHKINTGRLIWLINLHSSIIEEETDENIMRSFSIKLFQLSRDPKEDFLWTMARFAREHSSIELENKSIAYANLATCLLSIDFELREQGYIDLADQIRGIEEITALDAISDISELYNSVEVNIDHMLQAIRKQLHKLKGYANQIIDIETMRKPFQKILVFTDIDLHITEDFSIEQYIDGL
ncbi:MAG: hypothetical protein HeimC2_15300 [Candidatus Heimdallarchaeota archaeon LC_2]|nr:MAG: hypothetical protein HeimC2_15300 [Candidatus Heimdallarchaeota archaeon LC_2]